MPASPGDILLLHFRHLGISHRKYCVLLSIAPRPQFFLINGELNTLGLCGDALAERRRHFLCLTRDPNYRFLRKDSWLDCTLPHGYGPIDDLDATIRGDPTATCGRLVRQDQDAMLEIVRLSPYLSDIKRSWILAAFDEVS